MDSHRPPAAPAAIRHVAIVGAGFSGTLLAINLLRHDGPAATLIERGDAAGLGVAYGTRRSDHLLNVRAANMSAFPDRPGHFVEWLAAQGMAADGAAFVPRRVYGAYLRDTLAAARVLAPDRLRVVAGEAVAVDGATVTLADGGTVAVDAVVLAVGNLAPQVPPGLEAIARHAAYVGNPWDPQATRGLGDGDTVLLVGTGLTMVDVALSLEAQGFGGRMVALSRRGLLPHRHAPASPAARPLTERPRPPLSALVRAVRERGQAIGWRSAIDELRPFTQGIWAAADADERRRFLRHLRPWWDIHRHRLAPAVADRIDTLVADGRLTLLAGKCCEARTTEGGVAVDWRPRGGDARRTIAVARVISCIGPQGDVARTDDPLLGALVGAGRIRPDAEHLGIEVEATGRVLSAGGDSDERLFAIGPMTRGAFWEIVAVPDLRRQVWDVARYLSNAHWVGGEGL
ncbi:MAG: FAD-dependent oxidoreductase [Sphingomonas hengshuiensis]|uniref:FAD-dependent oxidoreductase n=1 Tax=Sphingomonas hengshuiensis TaxID=1609977 RepID=A0A2W4YVF7_9SPHN|nr:MAG: FAD-dependent oxidoreductase [Sphingomonas hengshuiensis]